MIGGNTKDRFLEIIFLPTEKQVSNKILYEIFHPRTHEDHVFYASLKAV